MILASASRSFMDSFDGAAGGGALKNCGLVAMAFSSAGRR